MNKKKRILFCDLDGCLADFELALYTQFPEVLDMNEQQRETAVDDFCMTKNRRIFRDLKLMPFAREAYDILCEHYDVYLLSTPMACIDESWSDKKSWADEHLGTNSHKKLILSHNKGLMIGDYLIDDRIKHGVAEFTGEHIHFGQEGYKDWIETLNYLGYKDGWHNDNGMAISQILALAFTSNHKKHLSRLVNKEKA